MGIAGRMHGGDNRVLAIDQRTIAVEYSETNCVIHGLCSPNGLR